MSGNVSILQSLRVFLLASVVVALAPGCECGSPPRGTCRSSGDCEPAFACIDGRCARGNDDGGVPGADGGDGGAIVGEDGGIPSGRCTVTPAGTAFESPALELHWRGEGLPFPELEQAIMSPVVIDFLEDGPDETIPEIIFVSYRDFNGTGVLRIVSGRPPYETRMTLAGDGSGPVLDDTMAVPMLRFDAHPAAGDLDGDGAPELVALLEAGGAVAYRRDGTELWRTDATMLPRAAVIPNASVALADLDHDGTPEVIVGNVVMSGATGAVRWTGMGGRGVNGQGPLSCVADVVPTSPGLEVIAGNTVYSSTGEILWRATGTGDGFCAIADVVDATGVAARDGMPEVIRVAAGVLYVHDGATGALRWMRNLPTCMSSVGSGGAPTVADFDGDGLAEIGVAGAFCYTVFDPACSVDPRPAECAGNGLLWRVDTEDDSSNVTSSTVFDFNGDGAAEVIYNDEQNFLVFEGRTGAELYRQPNPSRTRTEQPIVADVDNDGNAEIVFTANNEAAFAGVGLSAAERIPGVEIWSSADDSWVGARTIWNQHTYHIDNIDPLGRIPRDEAASWLGHNTYRLNVALEDALLAPDLVGEASSFDESRCGEGILIVCAEIRNRGDVLVGPGLEVSFYDGDPDAGGTLIGTATTTRTLEPRGAGERVCADWVGAPTDAAREVFVRVDSAGGERECFEDNNTASLGEGRCDTIM
ncbi:MAG: FG-GAP-like repeat-containing protein [Myxococcota bacterium]|nr:FG-GAP-like repeat-containing protein [Myxococcota bacterium]